MSDETAPKQVDQEGRPYITLAQFIKKIQVAGSGGEAKAIARSGEATVNGEAESRPGRKLRAGDKVTLRGAEHVVALD
jgi:ribosome-associated protein